MRRSNARIAKPNLEEKEAGMEPVKLQFRSSRPGFRSPNGKFSRPRSRICFYLLIFAPFLLLFGVLFFRGRVQERWKYGVVIDGGSTGTRIHVFKYEVRHGNLNLDFSDKGSVSMRVNPGLSAYADNPERAGGDVVQLVEFAKRNVPREQWAETQVRLMATAGMRLLKNDNQERILNACRSVLINSGFVFQNDWATIISGSDEGLYGWVVANYALGTLGAEPVKTSGIIELGGASAQVTFVTDDPVPPEFLRTVKFQNFTYLLYSHSLLHFGQNVAFESLQDSLVSSGQGLAGESIMKQIDPCTPQGYEPEKRDNMASTDFSFMIDHHHSKLQPNGNFSECRLASLTLLQKGKDKCSYTSCYIGSVFIPKLQGTFLATENFFHTSKFFGLGEKALLSDLVAVGHQFCGSEWSKLTQRYSSVDHEELLHYCFSSAYIVAFLHDSLGIAMDDQSIRYVNQVNNIPLDWAVGAFILQTADVPSEVQDAEPNHEYSSPLLLVSVLVIVFVIAIWLVMKWRKPQVKTIYDLEKGKYIVTHVSR